MKITISYKDSHQISPDDFAIYTKIIHLDDNLTLKEAHEILTKDFGSNKNFDAEIHFDGDEL